MPRGVNRMRPSPAALAPLAAVALSGVLTAMVYLRVDDEAASSMVAVAGCVLLQTVVALRARRRPGRPLLRHVGVASAAFVLAFSAAGFGAVMPGAADVGLTFSASEIATFVVLLLGLAAVSGLAVVALTAAVGRLERRV
jgi:hypothetical protein